MILDFVDLSYSMTGNMQSLIQDFSPHLILLPAPYTYTGGFFAGLCAVRLTALVVYNSVAGN
jgi:hypothetical protein